MMRRIARGLAAGPAGQAYIEFLLLLPIALLLIAGVIFFGRVLYVQIALENAAYDGLRAGIASLNSGREVQQAQDAVKWTMAGYHLDARDARTQVGGYLGGRGHLMFVKVDYYVTVGDILFVDRFFPGAYIPLGAVAYGRIDEYKSLWE